MGNLRTLKNTHNPGIRRTCVVATAYEVVYYSVELIMYNIIHCNDCTNTFVNVFIMHFIFRSLD